MSAAASIRRRSPRSFFVNSPLYVRPIAASRSTAGTVAARDAARASPPIPADRVSWQSTRFTAMETIPAISGAFPLWKA